MEPRLDGLARHLATGLVGSLTLWVALWSWRGFLETPGDYLWPLLLLALVVGIGGGLARWVRLPALLVVLGEVVVTGLVAMVLLTGSLLPTPATGDALVAAFRGAAETAQLYAAPVPADVPGLEPLLIGGGLVLLLLVDLLAGTARRASLAGLPLLTAVAVPVSMLGGGVAWPVFTLTAAGFLALLVLQEDEQVERWGRSLDDGRPPSVLGRRSTARAAAAAVGALVTALALVVPTGVPSLGLTLLDGPFGAGGDDEIQLDNPMVDLRRDLKRPEDRPAVRVRTDDPDPSYLRITVLSRFSLNAWSSGERSLPDEQRADGPVPGLSGVDERFRGPRHDWTIEVLNDFPSPWLPTPYPATEVRASGNWKYDLSTMDFLASSDGLDAEGLSYSATRAEVDVSTNQLALAPAAAGLVDEEYTQLPDDLPDIVTDLAEGVAADLPTKLEQAKALQQWFRSEGGFEYTLDRDDGNGGDALVEFLTEGPGGRQGYCEQFASAMAVMARSLGIPSRVSIGFLQPEALGGDTYLYSTDDLHSWPELYFPGAGWVRFEPTPAGRAPVTPSYTRGAVQLPDEASGADGLGEDALPDRGGAAGGPDGAPEPDPAAELDTTASDASGVRWAPLLASVAALLVLLGLVLLPALLRRRRSARRWLADSPAGAAWAELRDSSIDLGLGWPSGRSPRATAEVLLPAMAAGAVAAEHSLRRLVQAIEEQWYAASAGQVDADALRADVERCVEALGVGVTPRRRLRARWLPASLWRRTGPAVAARSFADADRVG